ncbi:metal ABC transporter permease [Neotabrizicola sp. VNH66]|uniref:metal ABC transporter permease n=1 Tax=Neotabrizicola sp. VNH66 TaxID=3400918 RepID=UPI003BFBA70C
MIGLLSQPETAILLTGVLLSAAAALPGNFLVLRGNALLTDAISHSVVFGIAVTWLATGLIAGPVQVLGAAAAGLLTVLAIEALSRSGVIRQDAAMGLVFPTLFAAGVLILNLYARDIHLDIDTVLLGEIAFVWLDTTPVLGAEVPQALLTLAACAALNAAYVVLFWKQLKLATFDPDLARLQGMRPGAVFSGLLALTATTAVAALDAVGAILFVAFVIVPPATAFLLTRRLSVMVPLSVALGVGAVFLGHRAAFALDVSIGGSMALTTAVLFIAALLAAPEQGMVATLRRRRDRQVMVALRTLVSHLSAHADGPRQSEENTVSALEDHLRWSRPHAERVILRGLDAGLIRREGGLLALSATGQAMAREIAAALGPGSNRPG